MSKPKHERALADHEAQAILSNVRTSPRKLNLVAAMIRNMPAQRAIATLTFSKRRIAHQVRKTLESAKRRSNAGEAIINLMWTG